MSSTGKQKGKIVYGKVNIAAEDFEPRNTKIRISMFVDGDVLDAYKKAAEGSGKGYQTLMQEKLRAGMPGGAIQTLETIIQALQKEMEKLRSDFSQMSQLTNELTEHIARRAAPRKKRA